jgi:hypothetical protein
MEMKSLTGTQKELETLLPPHKGMLYGLTDDEVMVVYGKE